MSDDENGGKSINWGGLVKGIIAGAAVVAGIFLIAPTTFTELFSGAGAGGTGIGESLKGIVESLGPIARPLAGAAIATVGLTQLFSDGSSNENAERHSQAHHEAKESFAIREDMRKMQTVMMARMKAAGHEPAMAMAAQPTR